MRYPRSASDNRFAMHSPASGGLRFTDFVLLCTANLYTTRSLRDDISFRHADMSVCPTNSSVTGSLWRKLSPAGSHSVKPAVFIAETGSDWDYFFASFGLLAPYLERACLLLATPAVSSVPRMMWYLVPGRSFTLPPRIITTLCSCRLCPSPGM